MKILYKPHFVNSNKDYYTISIILDNIKTNHNAYHINSNKIVSDLKNISKRLSSTLETIDANHFIIHLSQSIVDLKETTKIQHILWKILKQFLPWKHNKDTTVIITHDNTTHYKIINDFVKIAEKIRDARLIAMTPANIAYPSNMINHFKEVFENIKNTKVTVINYNELKKKALNLILAVGDSAQHKPEMLIIERYGNKNKPTICIVGKGITFDSGGLSIKGISSMMDMKFDKIGACYGAYSLAHLIEIDDYKDYNFIGIFPFAENAVSSTAVHPGDVIKSYLGKTVEITDPDAEGRLILADAFGYSHKFKPNLIIDIATLTGHAESINCWHHGYYYAVPDTLKNTVEKLSYDIGEPMLPMPTWNDHDDVLDSEVADLANDPRNCSDAFTATLFMKQFIPKNTDWLHIDLSHEFDNHVPHGNGIRTIISVAEWWINNKQNKSIKD